MSKTSEHSPAQRCAITGKPVNAHEAVPIGLVRPLLADQIRKEHPDIAADAVISRTALDVYRSRVVEELLHQERGELSNLEREVVASLSRHEIVSRDIEADIGEGRTSGERAADVVALFGGSWTFILSFSVFVLAWMAINIAQATGAFDPYPFILLNLVLSCLAAIQAPIIMMSQSRKDAKDRLRAQSDYRINLKAELEIRNLHEKIDHILMHQWDRLTEIQKIQLDMLQELVDSRTRRRGAD